jgi:hypothetical protein
MPKRAGSRIRTDDLLITNQLLYQLSYAGIYARRLAGKYDLQNTFIHLFYTPRGAGHSADDAQPMQFARISLALFTELTEITVPTPEEKQKQRRQVQIQ